MGRYVVSTDYVSSTHDLLFLGFHIGVDFYTAIYDKTSGTTMLAGKIFTKIPFNMTLRFRRLERRSEHRKDDTEMLTRAMFACLDGLHQMGANGPVTQMRNELEEYIIKNR